MGTIEPDASFMAAVCLRDDNCHMGDERQGDGEQKIWGRKSLVRLPLAATLSVLLL